MIETSVYTLTETYNKWTLIRRKCVPGICQGSTDSRSTPKDPKYWNTGQKK